MDADRTAVRIFDLVDMGQIGQADGALETALAKHPQHDGLRAAEALVLLRQGQVERAKALALSLSTRDIKEAKAVNALVHVLQQCCCWEALAATYERLRPLQNERQVSENLVQTYVRMGNYAMAQQVATQLYRAHAEAKYQVWMVQACLGQVPADSTAHLMLKLATRLLDVSVLTDKGVVTPATVRTYVDVLQQQGLCDEAVSFLCSERGAKIGLLETRLEVLARVLARQGKRVLANAAARQLWVLHPDNWTPFELYADTLADSSGKSDDAQAVLELAAAQEELRATVRGADADHTLDAAVALARELQEAQKASRKPQRGPFLAELALLERVGDAAGLRAAVLAYVQRFYRKPCCYLDVSTFLTPEAAAAIYTWSRERSDDDDDGGKTGQDPEGEAQQIARHTRRILGLRCHVAAWGTSKDALPPPAELQTLMAECATTYKAALPLSASLEWNEEGHCDAYISVALSVAVHAYHAYDRDPHWVLAGLELMHGVERRMNNSVWLIHCACLASVLGLVDTAAHHQLAFKSVQHDTMAHIGYWPLVRGLALDDVATWEALAWDYYARVERDCSLLRAKVFTFTSWPAMQDVRRFQEKQANALHRWLVVPHECVVTLVECQTQKNIFELFQSRGPELQQAWAVLGSAAAQETLLDNTDWTVARSVVLGNIHSDKVRALTDTLVQAPSFEARLVRGRQLLASLLLLRDVATLEQERQAATNAPKPRKAKKRTGDGEADAQQSQQQQQLYTPAIVAMSGGAALDCLPALAPLAAALQSLVESRGAEAVAETAAAPATEALAAHLAGLTGAASAELFETFLYPEAYLLAALVRVLPVAKSPAHAWAAALHAGLSAAQAKFADGSWSVVAGGDAAVAVATSAGAFTGPLVAEKAKRVGVYLADLLVDVAASSRRK